MSRVASGLRHPVGLGMFAISLALALAALLGAPWQERGLWLVFWGVLAYVAVVITSAVSRSQVVVAQEMRRDTSLPRAGDAIDLSRLTEEALRHLRDPAALARCELASHLPRSLAQMRTAGETGPMTPLELAQLLRKHIEASMEKLRLSAQGEPEALQYAILHGEYVLGLPNTAIMARHSVSESTFHRSRRAGVRALAADLQARELLLR